MLRKNFFFLTIFFSLTIFVNANDKIVYIDINYILNNSIPGKSILLHLDTLNKDNIAQLKKDEQLIIDAEISIKKKRNIISDEEFKNEVGKINNRIQKLKDKKKFLVQEFNQKKKDKISKFISLINPLVEDFMKTNSIGLILDKNNIFISKSNYDITMDILKIVDNNIKSISNK